MKTVNRTVAVTLVVILAVCMFAGCGNVAAPGPVVHQAFTSMHDIPGVTEDEIAAIEALREQRDYFIYGTILSTETFIDVNGEFRGFTVLLCDWLAELLGIPFEIRLYEWSEMLEGLESGEIDFTGELTATDERRKTYFMTDAIAGRSTKYMRIIGSAPLSYIEVLRKPRFAFLRGTTTYDDVREEHGDRAEYFLADGYEEAYDLLKNEEVDAFIDESTAEAAFDIYGNVVSEDYFPLLYGPVSLTTQNPANEPVISVVQKALQHSGIHYLAELYNLGDYEYRINKLTLSLTPEELAYIRAHPTIPFAAEYDNYPTSFYNSRERQWQGICFDVLAEVEALTGLTFKRIEDDFLQWPDLLRMLETGEASVISELIRTPEREGHFLWPDISLLTDYYALLSRAETRKLNINEVWNAGVGLTEGTAHTELFETWFPNHMHTRVYINFDRAFSALLRGEVDMIMASKNQLLVLTNYQGMAGYKANIIFEYPLQSTLGFYKGEEILCSIVEKALRLIDIKAIADDWTGRTYDYREKLAQSRLPWLIGAIILLVCLVFVLIVLNALLSKSRQAEIIALEAEMREQELLADNETLDRLNRMKTEFFQNMSHDFKTPLTVISTDVLNAVDMLDFEMDKEEMRSSLNNAQHEIMRMARMVDGAMRYSALQDKRKDMEPMDLAPLLHEGAESFRPLLDLSGNVLSLSIPSSLPKVLGNADMLLHVMLNLLSNANRYTRDGEIAIKVLPKSGAVHVIVEDNGSGVKPELLDTIFERGVSDKGTGLGLSICKTAVEAHGGTIMIESEYGRGTAVTFTLPIYKEGDR